MFDLFDFSTPISCEFCTLPIPIKPDSSVHRVQLAEGPAIFPICPTCGRLQRPRLAQDGKLHFVHLSDDQMATLQSLHNMNLLIRRLRPSKSWREEITSTVQGIVNHRS